MVLLAISIALGLLAVFVAQRWVEERTEIHVKKVVVAAQDLAMGTQLRPDMLEVIDWPAAGGLKDFHAQPQEIYQRVINASIMKGEPVTKAKLAPLGEKSGLSALLHEGTRAITVKVNEIVGVAGFALPGNYVDVIVNATDKSGKVISKIVLERILVLALAQDASTHETKPRLVNAVTLEVTPSQAEQIDLARSVGSLSLVLRSQMDKTETRTTGASIGSLFGSVEPALVPAAKPAAPAAKGPALARKVDQQAPVQKAPPKPEVIRGIVKTTE